MWSVLTETLHWLKKDICKRENKFTQKKKAKIWTLKCFLLSKRTLRTATRGWVQLIGYNVPSSLLSRDSWSRYICGRLSARASRLVRCVHTGGVTENRPRFEKWKDHTFTPSARKCHRQWAVFSHKLFACRGGLYSKKLACPYRYMGPFV